MTAAKNIEVPEPLTRLGEAFKEAGHELYLVGGYVRDALMSEAGKDVDATTGARPKEIKRLLGPVADYVWSVGERFGTVGARVGSYDVEVTTYRSDLYTAGSRHPEVTFGDTLEEDLARRDFTINAIAAEALTGEILDPFGGRDDLGPGIVRAVGDPLDRMRDDPLRMLRAVRFETTLSRPEKPFAMTPDLESAIKENAGSAFEHIRRAHPGGVREDPRFGERRPGNPSAGPARADALHHAGVSGNGGRLAGKRVPPQRCVRAHPDRGLQRRSRTPYYARRRSSTTSASPARWSTSTAARTAARSLPRRPARKASARSAAAGRSPRKYTSTATRTSGRI